LEKDLIKMMFAGKKGIMLKFLITLLLAIIIFAPACLVGSKFFRLSGQAKSNFEDLAVEIMNVQENPVLGTTRPAVLIQDVDTYVYFVTDKTRRQQMIYGDETYVLNHPAKCEEMNCICLCREYTEESLRSCIKYVCKELPGVKISHDTEKIVYRDDDDSRRQTVRISKCVSNTPYCRGDDGEISVIFNKLDDKGAYDAIK